MIEILAPAGNVQCARAAIQSGADAVYLGYTSFSARQGADNFDLSAILSLVREAHAYGVKVYVAMNTLVKDDEIEGFVKGVIDVWNAGVDAVIMQDLLLGKRIKECYPAIVLHASTQAGTCNENGAQFAKDCGFSRVILARETPIEEICKIAKIIETEVFVQGALCTCFSGQCYFSSFIGGNSGNRGRCKQPCRKRYFYNRNGNTEYTYALSLSDLSVGEDIRKLIDAGVVSFKIEGRMRRAEYVAAATQYYRAILDGTEQVEAFSRLKRTYNRGNYTKGLAFGQDKRFLSTVVQGHIGEKIGVIKVINGRYLVETPFIAQENDAFKILREGQEVGGAFFEKKEKRGFAIRSKQRLRNGDSVFVTTDTATSVQLLSVKRAPREVCISLYFTEGKQPVAVCGDRRIEGENTLQSAQNRPLTQDELMTCFSKTDTLPVRIVFDEIVINGNIFIPKAELNAFRRRVYAELESSWTTSRMQEVYQSFSVSRFVGKNTKMAVLSHDFSGIKTDIAIYKADDMTAPLPMAFVEGDFEKFIYYPAFCTKQDEVALGEWVTKYALGVYAESYAGVRFAKECNAPVFVGTGLNVTNAVALDCWLSMDVQYVALSKELNEHEIKTLACEKTFALSSGDIKLMDLCYCPFAQTCSKCDKRDTYVLTDENGREFPVRRYVSANGECRFEVYNCASLVSAGVNGVGKLLDVTLTQDKQSAVLFANDEEKQKNIYAKYTSGHLKRGVL